MNFKFEGVTSGDPSRIEAGVRDVVIVKVEEGTLPYGNNDPSVDITFQETDSKATHTEKFSMSTEIPEDKEKSTQDRNLERIKHIGTKIVDETTFNTIKNVNQLSALLVGKKVRIKFAAREYQDKEGNLRVATQLPNFFFAESITVTPTKLKYDPTNKWDYKKLNGVTPSLNGVAKTSVEASVTDSLPF